MGSSQEARVAEWSKHPGQAEIDEAGVVARWSTQGGIGVGHRMSSEPRVLWA